MKDNNIEKRQNEIYAKLFIIVLSGKLFLEFISVFLGVFFHVSSTSSITFIFFSFIFFSSIYFYLQYGTRKSYDLIIVLCIYVVYFLNYILYGSKEYYTESGMILLYVFYIPFSFCILAHISNWSVLELINKKYLIFDLIIGVATSILSIVYRDIRTTTNSNYMVYSYTILPIICLSLYCCGKKKNILLFLFSIVNIILLVFYGARMCFFLAMFYFVITYYAKTPNWIKIFYLIFIAVLCGAFINILTGDVINYQIQNIANSSGSYILTRIAKGSLFDLGDRRIIYNICINEIKNMGWRINGFFFDRKLLFGITTYAHNIIYEALLSLGWIMGSIFLLSLLYLILKALKKTIIQKNTLICLAFIISFFVKFFISSSFLTDGSFYMFLGLIISFIRISSKKELRAG